MDELFPASLAMIQASVNQNNAFSAEQAAKQIQFQREMSNTAHQREIADLKAAGLNPVLSAKLGGASTPSGSAASADTSGTSAIATLASEMMRQVASGFASGAFGAGYGASAKSDLFPESWSSLDEVPASIMDQYHFTNLTYANDWLSKNRNGLVSTIVDFISPRGVSSAKRNAIKGAIIGLADKLNPATGKSDQQLFAEDMAKSQAKQARQRAWLSSVRESLNNNAKAVAANNMKNGSYYW